MKKRQNDRVEVNLPVSCSLENGGRRRLAAGFVRDLSISGMRISLPVPFSKLKAKILDFILELPAPFSIIRGTGEIQWARWDAGRRTTQCGVKLSPLSLRQLSELESIVREVGGTEAVRGED